MRWITMREKVAEAVKAIALKTAKRSVGKSAYMGVHEIEVPKQLLDANKNKKA